MIGTLTNLPQLIKIIQTKQTKDISLMTYLLLDTTTVMWLVYGIALGQPPLIINGTLVLICVGTITVLKLKYC